MTKKIKERVDEQGKNYFEYDEPHSIIELTLSERTNLKRSIIESRDPFWAYYTFIGVSDLSEGERMVLKGIIVQTKDVNLACYALCNTDFIPHLNVTERAYLKKLAVQVKNKYNAEKALTYIYDLTPEEKGELKKVL